MKALIKLFVVLLIICCMSGCSDKSVDSDELSASTEPTVGTTVKGTTLKPSSTSIEAKKTSATTTKVSTLKPSSTSTEAKKTSATTTKVTTTTAKATTTAKKTTTTAVKTTTKATTTTKKTVTTAKTTTTVATTSKVTTTTTAQKIYLTQDDIDKLVVELQEYSDSLESAAKNDKDFADFLIEKYGSVEAWYEYRASTKTPSNSSWNSPSFFTNDGYTYEFVETRMKAYIDTTYKDNPNSHIVVYAQYDDGSAVDWDNDTGSVGWYFYLLR